MNNRKTILYILLFVLGLILIYNYFIVPVILQGNGWMGMGMNRAYNTIKYLVDYRVIMLIAIAIAVLLLIDFLKPEDRYQKCSKCGKRIESDRWKICPVCGTGINIKKENMT